MDFVVLRFENSTRVPHTYWIEPWAHDFTMLPGEVLELRVPSGTQPQAHIIQGVTSSQIYLEEDGFVALHDGRELVLGHNRQHEVKSGTESAASMPKHGER